MWGQLVPGVTRCRDLRQRARGELPRALHQDSAPPTRPARRARAGTRRTPPPATPAARRRMRPSRQPGVPGARPSRPRPHWRRPGAAGRRRRHGSPGGRAPHDPRLTRAATGSAGRWCRSGRPRDRTSAAAAAAAHRPRRPRAGSPPPAARVGHPSHVAQDVVGHALTAELPDHRAQLEVDREAQPVVDAQTWPSGPSRQWPALRSVLLAITSNAHDPAELRRGGRRDSREREVVLLEVGGSTNSCTEPSRSGPSRMIVGGTTCRPVASDSWQAATSRW